MTHGSLFTGIGGFDLAFDRVGIESTWQVEIDANCGYILDRHWYHVYKRNDVREASSSNLDRVDVISFGSPCQDFSIAGKRAGMHGKQSGLLEEALRICRELQPTIAVWENVPGALSSNAGLDFTAVLSAFRDCGARDIGWRTLDAQGFGVPQRRRRVFVVADFGGKRAGEILFESESVRGDLETSREEKSQAARVAGTLSACGAGLDRVGGYYNEVDFCVPVVSRPITTSQQRWREDAQTLIAFRPNQSVSQCGEVSETIAPTLKASPNSHPAIAYDPKMGGKSYSAGVLTEISPTLKAARPNAVGARRLTPVECARLQGFPDDWNEGLSDTQRYRQYGNAVAVPVAQWIGNRIVKALGS